METFGNEKSIKPFVDKIWLSSPTMHGEELKYITEAYQTNWMSTVGENINKVEQEVCDKIGCKHAVALSTGTAALHLAVKLCAEKIYGKQGGDRKALEGHKIFCTDMTFSATVNPIVYEGGEPVFIDTEYDTWNMDPNALEKAFEIYPDVRIVILVHLYGTPCKIDEIKSICDRHNALIVEDAAESFGALYNGRQTGMFGAVGVISYNGNKIITGSSGGMLLTNSKEDAGCARKWSTQSRENAPWYQHEEIGYNYRMSNVIAGIVRGQLNYLEEHIAKKKAVYMRYKEGLGGFPVCMNPYDEEKSEPNFWLSCILIDKAAMCRQIYGDVDALYVREKGKTCPAQILEMLMSLNAEGRPIWKPMHMQPIYRMQPFVARDGTGRAVGNDFNDNGVVDVGRDIFERGLCLPSDIKMTEEQQMKIIECIKMCFG